MTRMSGDDPLLASLADARARMLAAEAEIRLLIAYGREFARPRPYRLADLAGACGMSISGVRTAYTSDEVAVVAELISRLARTATTTEQGQCESSGHVRSAVNAGDPLCARCDRWLDPDQERDARLRAALEYAVRPDLFKVGH